MPVHTDHRAHSVRVLSHGRVPRCSSPRQRSDISRGARGRDETWHVRPERRQVAAIKPRTVALEGQEQQSRRFRLQWLHCRAQVGPKRRRHQTLLSSPKARRAREHLGGQAGRWRANSPCLLWRDSLWLCFLRTCCGACSTEKETNRQRPHRRQRAMHASAARSTLACAQVHARRMCRLRAVHMRLHASTEPVHGQHTRAHAARLLCSSQPIITLVAALAVTRVAWATVRATGGRSEVAGARCTRVQPPTPPCVAKGCRLQAKGCRLQPPYDAGLQVAGVGRPASLTVGRGLAVACGQRGQLRAQRRLAGTEVAGTPSA